MKKFLYIAAGLMTTLTLAGCWNSAAKTEPVDDLMANVYNDGWNRIVADTRTGVQYFNTSYGGVCVMVDANGEPLIYEGEYTE